MSKQQTAVEWLINKIAEDYPEIPRAYREEYQKAKAMEKEQIKKIQDKICDLENMLLELGEQQ
jgi:hypothetical protein